MKKILFSLSLFLGFAAANAQTEDYFSSIDQVQQWVVPGGITSIQVIAGGARSGQDNQTLEATLGGTVSCNLAVTPGDTLYLFVGGQSGDGNMFAAGGYNGGGSGIGYMPNPTDDNPIFDIYPGGGGGATDIRIGGTALANRVIVAGGGGSGGGLGGGPIGGSLNGFADGGGGTQSAGGQGKGGGTDGQLGQGGRASNNATGAVYGGGGGYYGGGAGSWSGGGGSSYANPSLATNVILSQGDNNDNGYISIFYNSAGAITGQNYVCVGATVTLYDTTAALGGVWSSAYTSKATVDQDGVVTGLVQGVDTIYYTSGNSVASFKITVYNNPVISAGNDVAICAASSATLTATGGTSYSWSPATGLSCTTCTSPSAHPLATTSYVVTGTKTGCHVKDTVVVTVNSLPNAGTITGPNSGATGTTITLADTAAGGTWSSANTAIATVSTTGAVYGLADGTDTIKYKVTNGCGAAVATKLVTFVSPGAVAGPAYVCTGSTITLTDSGGANGGTWTVAGGHATINAGGVLTGVSQGQAIVKYTVSGVTVQKTVTVYASPTINAGSDMSYCNGMSGTLTATGGTSYVWSPAAGLSCTTCASPTVSATTTTAYVVTGTQTGCSAKDTIVVNVSQPGAGAITGASVANPGTAISLNDASGTQGGAWSSSNPNVSVSQSGTVTSPSAAIATITYSVTPGCYTSKAVTFGTAGTISGQTYVCATATINLANAAATTGGTWSSVVGHAAVNQSGVVTGITQGVDTIKYTYGTAVASYKITVYDLPNLYAGNDKNIHPGDIAFLNILGTSGATYVWSPATNLSCTTCQSPSASPTVTTTYIVKATKNTCVSRDTVTVFVTGNAAREASPAALEYSEATTNVKVYPNPTHNELNIELNASNEDMHITLVDVAGRAVAEIANMKQANGNQHVTYNAGSLASGIYYVHIELGKQVLTQKVVVE